jgi:hypothetical protein
VDRTDEGDELAGGVSHVILRSVNGGDAEAVRVGAARLDSKFVLRKGRRYQFVGAACDANGNCAIERLPTVRGR